MAAKEGIQGAIAGHALVEEMIKRWHVIDPYDPRLLDGDDYVLTVDKTETVRYLEHRNFVSHEIVFVPPDYVGHMTAKSKYGRMGLNFLNAAKAHSGFVGRLVLEIANLSNDREPITVVKGDPLIHFEFVRREGPPHVYDGDYMFQYMTRKETAAFRRIILEHFGEAYDKRLLRQQAEKRIRPANENRS